MVKTQIDYWVTGSSGHIGLALTKELIRLGYSVLGIDRMSNANSPVKDFTFLEFDLARTGELQDFSANLPAPDRGFIHLAALTGPLEDLGWGGSLEMQSLEMWDEAFRVNVTSAFVLSKEIFKRIKGENRPAAKAFPVVFVSSIYGARGPNPSLYGDQTMRNPAAYGSSKAALENLARYLSGTSSGRIRANSVAAGGIERNQDSKFIQTYSERTPAGRMATEDDIVKVIIFLLGSDSEYVSGHTLFADGGFSIW